MHDQFHNWTISALVCLTDKQGNVTVKNIGIFWGGQAIEVENVQQVVELAVDIATDCNMLIIRYGNIYYCRKLFEQLQGLHFKLVSRPGSWQQNQIVY